MASRSRPLINKPRRTKPSSEPRRQPAQDRGERRVQAILDAAERVIVQVGVEAATTNAIAAEAGAGVGSLYHFFPNKDAIIVALAARYQQDFLELARVMLEPEMATMPIPLMAERIVRPMAEYLRQRPAYTPVYHAVSGPRRPPGCQDELSVKIVAIVERLMRARRSQWSDEAIHTSAVAIVETVHCLLELAQELPTKARTAMIDETVRLVAVHAEMVVRGVDPLGKIA